MGKQVTLPGTATEEPAHRPEDLMDYEEAGKMVDRSKNAVRWWVRNGHLQSWLEEEGNPNSKRMVSRSEVMTLMVTAGKLPNPGGPGRGIAAPAPSVAADTGILMDLRVKTAELEGARAENAALKIAMDGLKSALEAEKSRASAMGERAEVERLRAAEWKDRADGLSAELQALRMMSGLPWWRKLLG